MIKHFVDEINEPWTFEEVFNGGIIAFFSFTFIRIKYKKKFNNYGLQPH